MPELPEVETVRQILRSEIIGKTIHKIEIYKPKDETKKRTSLIKEMAEEEFISLLKGKTICEIDRKGKWLFFILANQEKIKTHVLINHLKMTGKYFIEEKLLTPEQKKLLEKNSTEGGKILTFCLGNDQKSIKLTYCDPRRFGSFRLQTLENYQQLEPYKNIGLDLLNDQVSPEYLFDCYQKRQVPIKTALLEQDIISGIGNIYAVEILFRTKIHPLKKTNELTFLEVKKILTESQIVLKEALKEKGTSAFDFINPFAQEGSYQHRLKVYGRNKKPCFECGQLIKKIETNQRSTFFCPNCQKQ